MNRLKEILAYSGLLLVLVFILKSIEVGKLINQLLSVSLKWILVAIGITFTQPFLNALRIKTYLEAAGYAKTYIRCLQAVLATLSLNAVLPAKGGDLVKVVFLEEDSKNHSSLLGITIMERAIDVLILCVFSMVGSIYIGNTTLLGMALVVILIPITMLISLGRADKFPIIGMKLQRLAQASQKAWLSPKQMISGIMVAVACWSTNIFLMFCLLRSAGAQIEVLHVASTTPLAIFVGLLPISISGMGTRDAAFVHLLSFPKPEVIYAATFLYTAFAYWLLALVGLIFLGKQTLSLTMSKIGKSEKSRLEANKPQATGSRS